MSEMYKFRDPEGMYFTTTTAVGWVDVFTRPELKHIIIDSLRYCQKEKGLAIHAWCLMPSHLHMMCSFYGEPLSGILRDFKKHTTKEIIKGLGSVYESRRQWMLELFGEVGQGLKRVTNYKVWQDGNHPIFMDKSKTMLDTMDYIHNNPQRHALQTRARVEILKVLNPAEVKRKKIGFCSLNLRWVPE